MKEIERYRESRGKIEVNFSYVFCEDLKNSWVKKLYKKQKKNIYIYIYIYSQKPKKKKKEKKRKGNKEKKGGGQ